MSHGHGSEKAYPMDAELEKLRDDYAVAAKLADLGDYRGAWTYLSTKVNRTLGKWMVEQAERDTWADDQELRFFAASARAEQPSYQ